MNPIAIWKRMSSSDDVALLPLGLWLFQLFQSRLSAQLDLFWRNSIQRRTWAGWRHAGRAGIAVSRNCKYPGVAVEYALWVAGTDCQRTLYVDSGGQPGNRAAWLDDHANRITNGYFAATLPALASAWLRPRTLGFVQFQVAAAEIIGRYLFNGAPLRETLESLDGIWTALH